MKICFQLTASPLVRPPTQEGGFYLVAGRLGIPRHIRLVWLQRSLPDHDRVPLASASLDAATPVSFAKIQGNGPVVGISVCNKPKKTLTFGGSIPVLSVSRANAW